MKKPRLPRHPAPSTEEQPLRARVLEGAFEVFREQGFAGASTLDIATRAKASKRDLYGLFEDKYAILIAAIKERTQRMRQPLNDAAALPATRAALVARLVEFGISILSFVCKPDVLAVHRMAIAESGRAPEIGRALDKNGREANHAALRDLLERAQAARLIQASDVAAMTVRYFSVLWGDLLIRLLLGVREPPTADEIETRARNAAEALLTFHTKIDGQAALRRKHPSRRTRQRPPAKT